ncbi:MvaI/BcnI family restriction endonuclease [Oleiphilus sp. HI0079]|uniref:MvaI/BcnI family restriction endonuclease n=1 Tax=Oleiphilus sp. HI0079 TaxID=1822254 RepID=UPI0018D2D91F|nr:MvaI/BcnI family restriction endonuclease [Oleiphilus sp. HI0079]
MKKSIMDAHEGLRRFFLKQNLHDYDKQLKGTENKKEIRTLLIHQDKVLDTKTSLYRPNSKNGDPRVWVYNLKKFASSGDLIALCVFEDSLIAINCTRTDLRTLFDESNRLFCQWFPIKSKDISEDARELLEMLSDISARQFIPTMRRGDTGVGFTLESLLGIEANSSKAPDFRGIELKTSRARKQTNKQTTVFSQVPNWSMSNLKGSKDILDKHGRFNPQKERRQLFHEISCIKPNSYGLQLALQDNNDTLAQIYVPDPLNQNKKEKDVIWMMDKLVERVEEKHKETMWIAAETKGKGASEEFWYKSVTHTTGTDSAVLPILLESGAMTVHYLIRETPTGGAKDQGYLFKLAAKHLPTLFANITHYDLYP